MQELPGHVKAALEGAEGGDIKDNRPLWLINEHLDKVEQVSRQQIKERQKQYEKRNR